MKISIVLICLIALSGCEKPFEEYAEVKTKTVCNESDSDKRAAFILQCIFNANPKSDEEPEDWLNKCENFSNNLFCKKMAVEVTCYDKYCHRESLPRPIKLKG